jgi:hypothetical protein
MNGILDLLPALRGGEAVREIDEALRKGNLQMQSTGKGASVTITLAFDPVKNFPGAVTVNDTITSKLPQVQRVGGTVLFQLPDGGLSRKHPSQHELPGITLASSTEPVALDPQTRAIAING